MGSETLRIMLRPIIRFCLKRSLTIQDLLEAAKIVFIDVSSEEMQQMGTKVNVSRLSVMTGMHRRDVMRIFREGQTITEPAALTSRILGQWEQDPRFLNKQKKPRTLSLEGEKSEFRELCRLVSSDINPGTVLFELERLGMVERSDKGLKLKQRAYVPQGDVTEGFKILARDTEDLMGAVEENVLDSGKIPNLHGRTEYDNIAKKELLRVRKWLLKEGTAFHQKVRNFLSTLDKDINPGIQGEGGGKVIITTFSRTGNES